jgi:glycosyltransferase involved in cell wall biosynthesis
MSDADGRQHDGETIPAVSVVMPAYNTGAYIHDALASVFAQTFTDYEVIVVNDGSPDTERIERALEPYRRRIRYIVKPNGGVSSARNAGIREGSASLVTFLDSDDAWEPEYLAEQVRFLRENPEVDLVYPNGIIFGGSPEAGYELMALSPSEGEVTFESLLTQKCTVLTFVTARRDAILRAGLFDEEIRSCEDFDLWLRVIKSGGRIAYHRKRLVRYRRRAGSHSDDTIWMLSNLLKVLDKCRRMVLTPEERDILEREAPRYLATLQYFEAKKALTAGDGRTAAERFSEANRYFKSPRTDILACLLRLFPGPVSRAYRVRAAITGRR